MSGNEPTLHAIADGALLVEYPGLSDEAANAAAAAAARSLERRPPRGFSSCVIGARTLFLEFDPSRCSGRRFASLRTMRATSQPAGPRRTLRVPVVYGGRAGSDLLALAREAGLSPEEFARRHAFAAYRVAFVGFAPGFAYLTGLPGELHAARLPTPRPRVDAGAVAIGGPYTGVYPGGTPGGWRLIGRTRAQLFDPAADPPSLFLPGDEVRFDAVPEEQLLSAPERPRARPPEEPIGGIPIFRVRSPGVFSSLQGASRPGWSRYGVPPGGAMDPVALARANAPLGNAEGATAIEMTLVGGELEALQDATVCLAGSEIDAVCNAAAVALEKATPVRRGDVLRLGRLRGGARTYLAVEGGFASSPRFEISKRLASDDVLYSPPVSPSPRPALRSSASLRSTSPPVRSSLRVPGYYSAKQRLAAKHESPRPRVRGWSFSETEETVVRVVLDPREVPFSKEGVATFLSSVYRVSASSDRRGIRLDGEPISLAEAPDIPPEGTPLGGIQVARDGMPIVLGPDRPVTGGYARIATVIQADFPLLAQRPPGAAVRFVEVSLSDALAARVG